MKSQTSAGPRRSARIIEKVATPRQSGRGTQKMRMRMQPEEQDEGSREAKTRPGEKVPVAAAEGFREEEFAPVDDPTQGGTAEDDARATESFTITLKYKSTEKTVAAPPAGTTTPAATIQPALATVPAPAASSRLDSRGGTSGESRTLEDEGVQGLTEELGMVVSDTVQATVGIWCQRGRQGPSNYELSFLWKHDLDKYLNRQVTRPCLWITPRHASLCPISPNRQTVLHIFVPNHLALFYRHHLVTRPSPFSPPSSPSSAANMLIPGPPIPTWLRTSVHLRLTTHWLSSQPESDRLHLPIPRRPNAQTDHEGGGAELQEPPEEVCGEGAGVEGCGEEVEEVDGEGEVGDEFGAGEEDEDWYYSRGKSADHS